MGKTNDARRKSQTHFERVPVQTVKKIVERDVSKEKRAGIDKMGVEPTSLKKRGKPLSGPGTLA